MWTKCQESQIIPAGFIIKWEYLFLGSCLDFVFILMTSFSCLNFIIIIAFITFGRSRVSLMVNIKNGCTCRDVPLAIFVIVIWMQ